MTEVLKLGKQPAAPRSTDLQLADYINLEVVLPKVPKQFGHEHTVRDWLMLGNGPDPTLPKAWTAAREGAGDCVWAGAGHETIMWTAEHGPPAKVDGADAVDWYHEHTGYNPETGAGDNGTDVHQALNVRVKHGLKDSAGDIHKLGAYIALQPGNLDHLAAAVYLFGAVGIGIRFPQSAMDQFNAGHPWDVVKGASVEGGHYIPLVARRSGRLECVTWAKVQPMTVAFFTEYCDEAYALLSLEHLHGDKSPEGFDRKQLLADLKALA